MRKSTVLAAMLAVSMGIALVAYPEDAAPPASAPASAPAAATMDAAHRVLAEKLINEGVKFILSKREEAGGWSMGDGVNRPAMTGLILKTILQDPAYGPKSPEVKKAMAVLLSYQQKDGGIYDPKQGYGSYTTAVAVMAMAAAKDPQLNKNIREANGYLKGIQIQPGSESPDGKKVASDDPRVGGVDYGKNGQPNLSVMGFWMDAMQESGVSNDDPNVRSAMGFISRLQNRSESNPMDFVKKGDDDGGFTYSLVNSAAGAGSGSQGLRSYGSMTYVGFKSMLYAGLAKDDPRVQAAYGWIRRYWGLDSNPNMPEKQAKEGLYYYYQVFAKALRAWGEPVIVDIKGAKHNWREELIGAMAKRVHNDGSWVNDTDRWNEGNSALVTAYCVLALQETLKK